MPAKKAEKKEIEGLPEVFRSGKMHRPPSKGKIPLAFILEGICEEATKGEAKRVAPQETAQLKVHIDGVVEQLRAITRKLKTQER